MVEVGVIFLKIMTEDRDVVRINPVTISYIAIISACAWRVDILGGC